MTAWLDAANITDGPVFRRMRRGGVALPDPLRPQGIAQVVTPYAEKAGYDPADFSGHSLRSGFLTSAAARGASVFKLIEVSRHKSVDTLRGLHPAGRDLRGPRGGGPAVGASIPGEGSRNILRFRRSWDVRREKRYLPGPPGTRWRAASSPLRT